MCFVCVCVCCVNTAAVILLLHKPSLEMKGGREGEKNRAMISQDIKLGGRLLFCCLFVFPGSVPGSDRRWRTSYSCGEVASSHGGLPSANRLALVLVRSAQSQTNVNLVQLSNFVVATT